MVGLKTNGDGSRYRYEKRGDGSSRYEKGASDSTRDKKRAAIVPDTQRQIVAIRIGAAQPRAKSA